MGGKMVKKRKEGVTTKILWILIILGFAIMEFPGIYFINRIEPMILGMPFIYGFTMIMWAYMCIVLLIAYKTNWGKYSGFIDDKDSKKN
ncbi:hypothetical protein QBE52_01790 [Clostridiaceae bacterium 35-E11]